MKRFLIFSIVIIPFLFSNCTPIPKVASRSGVVRIPVGPGPEDIVVDTISTSYPRLLASCYQRRKGMPYYGEVCEINLNNDKYKALKRVGEPAGMVFKPHGFDLVKSNNGELLLYCISHNDEKKEHSIIIYKVAPDYLQFKEKLDSPLLVSPNDVTADCSGNIFVTNDAGKRGSTIEQLFKLKRSNVVRFNTEDKKWAVVANKLVYANGVKINQCNDEDIVLSTIRSNKLYLMQQNVKSKLGYSMKTLARLKGLDNITFLNDNEVLVTAHLRQIKFLKHYKNTKNLSPTVVYKVNINSGKTEVVYSNNGTEICGASTALVYKGKMYLSQVFEPFILKCDAPDLK